MKNLYMTSKGIFSGHKSIFKMNIQFHMSYYFKKIKVEVRAKEIISKEDIKQLLVKPSMEYSHYTTFVQKFVITMEYRKCNIALNVKKVHIFNSREEKILSHHEAWRKHFRKKGE